MPPRPPRRRRDRRTNVFVQENQPSGGIEYEDEPEESEDQSAEGAPGSARARARRARAQRTARQSRARSEVFTRTLGKEMRKVGMLSGAIVITLVVLTFVLN